MNFNAKIIFMNFKIRHKIFISMISITTLALFSISIIFYQYFAKTFERNAETATKDTISMATNSFIESINSLFNEISYFISSKEMIDTLTDIAYNNKTDYVKNYISLQDGLQSLVRSNDLIDSVMILGGNSEFFSTTDVGLNFQQSIIDWNDVNITGIGCLSVRKNPFDYSKDIIPFVFPISYAPFSVSNTNDSTANIFIFIDADKLDQFFQQMNKNVSAMIYLANDDGIPISVTQGSALYDAAFNADISDALKNADYSLDFKKAIDEDTYFVTMNEVGFCNLKLVNIISKNQLLSGIDNIRSFIFVVWVFTLIISFILSFLLSQTITRPLGRLMKSFKADSYEVPIVTDYHDEIGMLNLSLHTMSDVIQHQIETIKKDEQEKSQAEIEILTQQINPHFLYNTLECIHWEILAKNIDGSAEMVESLGDFLRLGLNYGSNTISLEKEVRRTEQYVNIMNHRFSQNIQFVSQIDPILCEHQVLKLILQPLAENCIKHGFDKNISCDIIQFPYICISAQRQEMSILISVEDNGIGINIEKATLALTHHSDSDKKNSVGLYNVYQRLKVFYGDSAKITFHTTPYYKNCVYIDIPFSQLT